MTQTITRRLEWDAGHRVWGHESKCKHLHGHRYAAEITVDSPDLDSIGRVIDYGMLKGLVGDWILKHWDHNFLLHPDDPMVLGWEIACGEYESPGVVHFWRTIYQSKRPYVMAYGNPTAENIARELREVSQGLLEGAGYDTILVTRVRIYETPNCWADAFPVSSSTLPKAKPVRTMHSGSKNAPK